MFEKCKEKLFKLLAFIHLLRNQAVTFGKRKEQVVCMLSLIHISEPTRH